MIEAQSVSVRNGDQKKIEKDFQGRKISQKPSRDEAMIDPAEGTFDLSEPFGIRTLLFAWPSPSGLDDEIVLQRDRFGDLNLYIKTGERT